jgi:hypothetical protein
MTFLKKNDLVLDSTPSSSFIPFPELDYAAWLPIMGEPSIMLGVTRVERYVLAIQVTKKSNVMMYIISLFPCRFYQSSYVKSLFSLFYRFMER